VRDAIETFVPLAKRIGWLSRRLGGLITSTLGGVAVAVLQGTNGKGKVVDGIRVSSGQGDAKSYNAMPVSNTVSECDA
jgi:hypothetical protein